MRYYSRQSLRLTDTLLTRCFSKESLELFPFPFSFSISQVPMRSIKSLHKSKVKTSIWKGNEFAGSTADYPNQMSVLRRLLTWLDTSSWLYTNVHVVWGWLLFFSPWSWMRMFQHICWLTVNKDWYVLNKLFFFHSHVESDIPQLKS